MVEGSRDRKQWRKVEMGSSRGKDAEKLVEGSRNGKYWREGGTGTSGG